MALHKTTWTVSSGTTLQQFWLELIFWFRYFVCPLATTNEGSNPSTLFLPTNWAKLCLVKCSFYKATMIVFSLSLADGLLVLNGHRGGTASARWSKTCPSSVACLLVSCPMHCGFFWRFTPTSVSFSHNLWAYFCTSFSASLLFLAGLHWFRFGRDVHRSENVGSFHLGRMKPLWLRAPVQSVSPTLCLCECPHGGRWVQPTGVQSFLCPLTVAL